MVSWLIANPVRFPMLMAIYFALHVLVRSSISDSLDYDESEQAFLTQFMLLGYNSQPPLYTWIQRATFEVFGYSVTSLALLKNSFIWLTYVLVFQTIREATGKTVLGIVAALAMLTIPQVAWESHRDLSHTVATMFSTSLLFYCVVMMGKHADKRPSWGWYVLLGFTVGLGALFKYNFAIVVFATVLAALSVPRFRSAVLDARLTVSVAIALLMVLPHAMWMMQHFAIASTKTIDSLSHGRTDWWLSNVGQGAGSLIATVLACCIGPIVLFASAFGKTTFSVRQERNVGDLGAATTQLFERFLIAVAVVLGLMVFSGKAVDFENRWFQPFIFLVPAWLTLNLSRAVMLDFRFQRNLLRIASVIMLVILSAIIFRPVAASYRGKYSRLNIPYPGVAEAIRSMPEEVPGFIFADDVRDAGNLRMQFPDSLVVCHEMKHLITNEMKKSLLREEKVWGFSSVRDPELQDEVGAQLRDYFVGVIDSRSPMDVSGTTLELPYLYGNELDRRLFWYGRIEAMPDRMGASASGKRLD